jgi:hypothetical protein
MAETARYGGEKKIAAERVSLERKQFCLFRENAFLR